MFRPAKASGVYEQVTTAQLIEGRQFKAVTAERQQMTGVRRAPARVSSQFKGKKKGLIILADFPNQKFQAADTPELYKRIANERNFKYGRFQGSVKDYFYDQSEGQFELDFDVVGPVTTDSIYQYYGRNDMDAYKMVIEACKKVDGLVNFKDYDWDGDGEVDQVFVLYAGQGASDGGGSSTIWPHEYNLVGASGSKLTLDGVNINTYACSNEVDANWNIEGIGTICHEFAHCMGIMDHYDTFYTGNFGTSNWDLMSYGEWNNAGFTPAGFLSFERMQCGWRQPIVLSDKDTIVTAMAPLSEGGDFYIIYNQANNNEYYLLENRQLSGWDSSLPGQGLLVFHVDYDSTIWKNNYVNTLVDNRGVQGSDGVYNDHQRLTIFHADNDDDRSYWSTSSQSYTKRTLASDPYPYLGNDSLTDNSTPAASLYQSNVDRHRYMNRAIINIKQNADSTISFTYVPTSQRIIKMDSLSANRPDTTGALFYESFNECYGTGGNDGIFRGNSQVASAEFIPDNGGWQAMYVGGAARCAKFGNASHEGITITPDILLADGTLEFSFYAAPWSNDGTELHVTATNGAVLGDTVFTMKKGEWTHFKTTLSGNGTTKLTFTPEQRFFLDEVLVRNPSSPNGISSVKLNNSNASGKPAFYAIDGTRLDSPGRGITIIRYPDGRTIKVAR